MPALIPSLSSSAATALSRSVRTAAPRAAWVSVVPHLDPKYGGLSSAVPALGSAVAEAGVYAVSLAGFCLPGEQFRPAVSDRVDVSYLPLSRLAWLRSCDSRKDFRRLVARASGVHIHGLWQLSTAVAARAAQAESKPYLISAHGMLERWAIANKQLKKSIYAAFIERANLQSAACLHALTEAEAGDYRRFGLTNPIAVIPNGVTLPSKASRDLFLAHHPELRGKRLFLFLGRLHFKKGLDILAEAWARLSGKWPQAHLVLAGPDFENTQLEIERRLAALGVSDRVTFTGMLGGDLKWSALAAADCFVLPSYSEGLSVSVLEAMGMGVPVLITRQCNLPEVSARGCGWVIEPQIEALEAGLRKMLEASARERSERGENGRRLVAAQYSWPAIGAQMSALYAWIAGGSRPAAVRLHEAVTT